jgi:prophage tail gpP-like protein
MQQPYAHRTALILERTQRVLPNFDRYNVKLDMLDLGNPFTFSLWYSTNAQSAWAAIVREVKLGGRVVFTIDDAPQVVGRIETLSVRVNRKMGAQIVISGRDLAGTAISWDADPRINMRNATLDAVIRAAFEPLGVPFILGDGAGHARDVQSGKRPGARGAAAFWTPRTQMVDRAKVRAGEKAMDFVLRIVRSLGYMAWMAPTADGSMAMILDAPDYDQRPTFQFRRNITNGRASADSNIIDSDYHAQIRSIPTVVTAYGRAERGDRLPTRHRTSVRPDGLPDLLLYDSLGVTREFNVHPEGDREYVTFDPVAGGGSGVRPQSTVTRVPYTNDALTKYPFVEQPLPNQPVHLHSARARTLAHGEQEARRTLAHAMKDFRSVDITVAGHGQLVEGQRRTYASNIMGNVSDNLLDMDEDLLLTGVEFVGSRDEKETKLTLGTKGAIPLVPEAQ